MKPNALFYFVFLLSFSTIFENVNAQSKNSITWGQEYKLKNGERMERILNDDGQNFYVLAIKGPSFVMNNDLSINITPTITKYDSKIKEVKSASITSGNKNSLYHDTYFLGGKFYGLTSVVENRTKIQKFYTSSFNADLGEESHDVQVWETHVNTGDTTSFRFNRSPDSTNYLISYVENKGSASCVLSFCAFDKQMKSTINKSEELKLAKKRIIVVAQHVDNNGSVFFLVKEYNNSAEKEEGKNSAGEKIPDYKIYILAYTSDGNSNKYVPDLQGHFLIQSKLNTNANGSLQMFSCISKENSKNIQGFSYLEWDSKSGKEIANQMSYISVALAERIDKMQDDNPKSKSPSIAPEFLITDFINSDDGSTYLVLEENYTGVTESTAFTSRGMLAIKISENKFQWTNFIPKDRYSGSINEFIYHKVLRSNNGISIIYDEVENNSDYDIVNAKKGPLMNNKNKDLYLMRVDFDQNGNMKGSIFLKPETINTSIDLKCTVQIQNNRLILCGLSLSGINSRTGKIGIMKMD